jgi:hypothetical protein
VRGKRFLCSRIFGGILFEVGADGAQLLALLLKQS